MLEKAELAKAGELLWGAIVENVKALSLKYKGEPIRSHKQIRVALKEISLAYLQSRFEKDWPDLNLLHVNYYETFMDEENFKSNFEKGKKVLAFITDLIYKPL